MSTVTDYFRFCQMLLNGGVAVDGTRVLGRRTVELFASNRLPSCAMAAPGTDCGDLGFAEDLPEPGHSGTNQGPGVGFGLGVAVVDEPAKAKRVCSKGEFYWVRSTQPLSRTRGGGGGGPPGRAPTRPSRHSMRR